MAGADGGAGQAGPGRGPRRALQSLWSFAGLVPALVVKLLLLAISLYRRLISPLLPPACRFTPTCSEYAAQCLERHGLKRGITLATWRILRCNPLCKGGFHDPPP